MDDPADVLSNLNDTHETEVCENGEADIVGSYDCCTKNPGHTGLIPIDTFSINNLPDGYRTIVLYDCIKSLAEMTVRIDAKYVSKDRKEKNHDKHYPFANRVGYKGVRFGTGRIDKIKRHIGTSCPCPDCHKSRNTSQNWMEVFVMTAKHVVFDDSEAKHTCCKLFYDNKKSEVVTLNGISVVYEDMEKDRCQFKCATCDVDLMNNLDKSMKRFDALWKKAHSKYKFLDSNRKLICIVSHPHGHYKMVSIGHSVKMKKAGKMWSQFFYLTPTCRGSSGAAAYVVGHTENFFYQHIHSGSRGYFNFSGLAW